MQTTTIKTKETQEKWLLLVMALITAAVVIPLLWVGFYDYRSVDDFWYSMPGEGYLREGKNFFQVVSLVWRDSIDSWRTVQGTLIATFTTRMLETYLSRNYYFVTPFIMLFFLAFSESLLFDTVLHRIVKFSKVRTACIFLIFFDLQLLYMPVPVEALYWLNGSSYYTIYYSLGMILVTLLLREVADHFSQQGKKAVIRRFFIVFLGLMVSLGNMVTALSLFCFYGLIILFIYIHKHRSRVFLSISCILYTLGALGNILAPGNGIRVDSAGWSSPVEAIIESFAVAFRIFRLNLYFPFFYFFGVVIAILAIRGFLLQGGPESKEKRRFRFPLLILFLSFLMLVAQYVPTMYTLGIPGAGRIQNLQRYTTLFLLYGNLIYCIGWGYEKWYMRGKSISLQVPAFVKKLPLVFLGCAVFGLLGLGTLYLAANKTVTTVSAIYAIRGGELEIYKAENEARIAIMEDASQPEVTIELFAVKPYLLFYNDVLSDDDPLTEAVRYYYGKTQVHVVAP